MQFLGKVKTEGSLGIIEIKNSKLYKAIETLDQEKDYLIEIREISEKKTLKQNAYAWKLISLIDKKINGFKSDEQSIYMNIIKQAKIKTDLIESVPAAKTELVNIYRYVEELERKRDENNREKVLFRCYHGMSMFTKSEMVDFIEVLLNVAHEYEIPYDDYLLEGGD